MNRQPSEQQEFPAGMMSTRSRTAHPFIAAAAVFLFAILCAVALVWTLEKRDNEKRRVEAYGFATDYAQALRQSLDNALSATHALAAMVKQQQGDIEDFDAIAEQMLHFYPGISSLGLSPQGIVAKVYPLRGNEVTLGFDQLGNVQQGPESVRARDTAELTLAGPMPLLQGGTGVVGRLPVFLENEEGLSKFWGFTYVTVHLDEWLTRARLQHLQGRGYQYRLWRTVPHTQNIQVIATSTSPPSSEAVTRTIPMPNGSWALDVMPSEGWIAEGRIALRTSMALLFGLLMAFLTKLFWEVRNNERNLEKQVAERTAQIQHAQQQLQAILDALPDLVFDMDLQGHVHALHHRRPELLFTVREKILGKSVSSFLPEQPAKTVLYVLEEAMRHDFSGGHVMALPLPDLGETWFELSAARRKTDPGTPPRFVVISRDITESRRSQATLILIQRAFDQSSEAIMLLDGQHNVLQVNRAFERITGYSVEEAIGKPITLFVGDLQNSPSQVDAMFSQTRTQGYWEGELLSNRKDSRTYPQWLSLSSVRDAQGLDSHHIGIFRDNSSQREAQQRIQHLAHYDLVTALPNRVLLAEHASRAIAHEQSRNGSLAILFIDLDHFKNINDTLGHRVGDALLVAVSKRLQSMVRQHDTLARLGGDEFLLVLPGTTAEGASVVATELLKTMSRPIKLGAQELSSTLSIGIALFPRDGTDFDTLYQRADTALFRAKRGGRNRFSFFTADLEARSARTLVLENAMHRALERNQFTLHYQPQVSLPSRQIIGAEALLRWKHPELGMISPAEFIPIAENSGQIVSIGEWVLRTAMRDAKAWLDEGLLLRSISVNISAVQFRNPHLPEMVTRCLRETSLPPQRLELELTEGVAIDDPEAALTIMGQLHERGPRLSMDDFGTGYSCLSHLKRFPLYKVKIDQSFVRDLESNTSDRAIVGAIIHMAQALGMVTTAEGVETEAQLQFLQEQGCDEGQGYLFSRPIEAHAMVALLRQQQGVQQIAAP